MLGNKCMQGPCGFMQKWHPTINTIVKFRKKGEQATRFCTQAADVVCTLPVALPILHNAVNCGLLYQSALDSKGLHPLPQCHCSHPNFIPMFVSSIKRKVYSKERL